MDNNNSEINNEIDTPIDVSKVDKKNSIKQKINLILQEITNLDFKNKLIKLAAFLVLLIFIVFIAAFAFRMIKSNNLEQTPSPLPTVPIQPEIKNLSPYSKDEEILKIKERIQKMEKELDIVNFREETLRIPSLDWEIKF